MKIPKWWIKFTILSLVLFIIGKIASGMDLSMIVGPVALTAQLVGFLGLVISGGAAAWGVLTWLVGE